MRDVSLLLYFEEEPYGRRFLRFLSGKRRTGFHPELVTDRRQLAERIGQMTHEMVILTDNADVYEDEIDRTILLTGEQNRSQKKILQYQCAEAIYEELLFQSGVQYTAQKLQVEKDETMGVVVLFSLDGCGVTATSVMLSQYLGQKGHCLYLSLSGFPVYYGGEFAREPNFESPGLGELLFCSSEKTFADCLPSLVQTFGNADLLAPPAHFKDLVDCSSGDWRQLLERLKADGGYDSVVIEIGQLFGSVLELLELGNRILVFSQNNAFGKVRREVFRRYCRMEEKETLLERVKFCLPPDSVAEWESGLPQQPLAEWSVNHPIMKEMERLCGDTGEEGEEDVCVWEDFG